MIYWFMRSAALLRLPAALTICLISALIFSVSGTSNAVAKTPTGMIADFLNGLKGTTKRTRFVIGLDRAAQYQVFSLSNPNRVIVELPAVRLSLPATPGEKPIGLVKAFRGGRSAPGKSRVVIDVTSPVIVENVSLRKPGKGSRMHQLVLDIIPVKASTSARQAKRKSRPKWAMASAGGFSRLGARNVQPPIPKRALTRSQRMARSYKPVIVLDPGHGGKDTGARRHGAVESHIVLAFAKELRAKLEKTGRYRVLMTRETDKFIPLDDRVDFGAKHNAALFIAIHADYAGSSARGATIYTLRSSTAQKLRRRNGRVSPSDVLTRKERHDIRKKARGNVDFVTGMLADLASRERQVTQQRTEGFRKTVIKYMGKTTKFRSKAHRTAGFRVLKTAKVPSVLIELAYVTNRRDAALLKSNAWRKKVSGSIARAVDNYFGSQVAQLPM